MSKSYTVLLIILLFTASNHRKVEVEVPEEEDSIQNDSFDLDMSIPSTKATKKRTEDKEKDKKASFVPAKGQKLAAKRLQKITGLFMISINIHFRLKKLSIYKLQHISCRTIG